MGRLRLWQLGVLGLPVVAIALFLFIAAGLKIQDWGISWIWAVVTLVLVGWRWLLVKWTQPFSQQMKAMVTEIQTELEEAIAPSEEVAAQSTDQQLQQAEAALQKALDQTRADPPLWEDATLFWTRCQDLIVAISHVYHPEVKYPLLSIYIPDAYALLRGTIDDLDQWMEKLSPVLSQVTVGQAYRAYEMYQTLEPSARRLFQVWNMARWVLNPAAAAARQVSQKSSDRATQQLIVNLGQLLREALLRNLAQQAIALYSGQAPLPELAASGAAQSSTAKTATLQAILEKAEPEEKLAQTPLSILLVGRTGAGKSSIINTLFHTEMAEVDVLPSTDAIRSYEWRSESGDVLTLWDTPGYEQVQRSDFREEVLDYAAQVDLLLLVTPALDPALQMDADFLAEFKTDQPEVPVIAMVTQVDRLRPLREWEPPYDWAWGTRPKEVSIREAVSYRAEQLDTWCDRILPLVTADETSGRQAWNSEELSLALIEAIAPTQQIRLARFLRNREARAVAAAKIIDHYTFQMATTQGLATFLKSPVLQFIATLTTGSPTLAYLLAEQIPIEQLPVVIGKLQMAYDLYNTLGASAAHAPTFDLLALWPLLLDNSASPDRNAWAFGHALVEYWSQALTIEQTRSRFEAYLSQKS
jgi:predicted GTPase